MKVIAGKLADQLEPIDFESSLQFKFKVKRILSTQDCKVGTIRFENGVGEITLSTDRERLCVWVITCQMRGDQLSIQFQETLNRSKN